MLFQELYGAGLVADSSTMSGNWIRLLAKLISQEIFPSGYSANRVCPAWFFVVMLYFEVAYVDNILRNSETLSSPSIPVPF